MKKTVVLLLMTMLCAGVTMAQKTVAKKQAIQKIEKIVPPEAVLNAFTQKYTADAVVEWSKKANGNFVAAVEQNGFKQIAEFNAEGKWLSTQTMLTADQLSEAAQTKLKEQYAEMQIAEVKKIEREGISVFYKVTLTKDKETKTVYINDAGFISS
ncbi:PepSY-like domain-containing protein [Lacibacter sp. MH-610]|uniref:PepSY-like domain-containing protein n=1 Tax=Lacibacter sp. MH-610 TaxID=3020883 RepID=UPI003891A091